MRKLSSVLLSVAAVGALVGSTLAVAGPAAADSWGHGYGRSERHESFGRARGFDGRSHDSRGGWGRSDWGRRDGGQRYGGHRWR